MTDIFDDFKPIKTDYPKEEYCHCFPPPQMTLIDGCCPSCDKDIHDNLINIFMKMRHAVYRYKLMKAERDSLLNKKEYHCNICGGDVSFSGGKPNVK